MIPTNADRIHYDQYRKDSLPIGSGKVEGACKFVVGKRFKGSGMRWKRTDNRRVLRARLAKLNGYLEPYFHPSARPFTLIRPEGQAA